VNADVAIKQPTLAAELGQRQPQFKAALPKHIRVEQFVRVVLTAVQANPQLAYADRASLWTACMKAAQDGLLPDGREGALVIYSTNARIKDDSGRWVDNWIDKVVWMPMIAGLRKKVRNSETIVTWDVYAVHERDQFEFELGDDPFVRHKPYFPKSLRKDPDEADEAYIARLKAHVDPGPLVAAYSVAVLKSGERSRDVMMRADIDYVRDTYAKKDRDGKFSPAWRKSYDEMAKKTVARRHSKVLPMSTDLDDLMRRDDELYDLKGESDKKIAGPRPSLRDRLDALAGAEDTPPHDAETGEIVEQVSGEKPETTANGSGPPAGERDAGSDGSLSAPPQSASAPADKADLPASASPPRAPKRAPPPPEVSDKIPTSNEDLDRAVLLQDLLATGERIARERGAAALDRWLDEDMSGDEQALLTKPDVDKLKRIAADADKARK
jgi:recombination protein RecT